MLTKNDIDVLLDAMSEKFVTIERHKKDHDKMMTVLDGIAKTVNDVRDELGITQARVNKLSFISQTQ